MTGRIGYMVHVTGQSPWARDAWIGPYWSLSMARAQATKATRRKDGTPLGDHKADICKVDFWALPVEESLA